MDSSELFGNETVEETAVQETANEPMPTIYRSSSCQAWRTTQHHGRSPVAWRTHGGGGQRVQVSVHELLHRVQHLPLLGAHRQRTHQLAHGLRGIALQEIIEIRAGSRCAGPHEWYLRVATANADDVHPQSALGNPEIFGVEDFWCASYTPPYSPASPS